MGGSELIALYAALHRSYLAAKFDSHTLGERQCTDKLTDDISHDRLYASSLFSLHLNTPSVSDERLIKLRDGSDEFTFLSPKQAILQALSLSIT